MRPVNTSKVEYAPAPFKHPHPISVPFDGDAYSKNLVLFESVSWLFERYLVLFKSFLYFKNIQREGNLLTS